MTSVHIAHAVISYALLAISLAAIAYSIVALACVLAFGRRRAAIARDIAAGGIRPAMPAMTILKPVSGDEPDLFDNLCSFCDQDYPQFQVVFGVPGASDPAAPIVEDVALRFPHVPIVSVVGGAARAANRKVAQLQNMIGQAAHDVLVVADSDTRVDRDYLRGLAQAFDGAEIGAVTCLYRAAPQPTFASLLGGLAIDDQYIPAVLVAALGTVRFCLGATMAVTRRALDAIGGFAALADYLADDQMLGELVHRQGLRVVIGTYVVDHGVDERDFAALWSHELRWARTNRAARPAGYAGYFLTYAWPPALAFLLVSGMPLAGGVLLGAALALRIAIHYASRWSLASRMPDGVWLFPLRDLLGLAVWACCFFGRSVRWRDRDLRIDSQGRIVAGS
ncbi:MAG: bacteriohopanetetrol glucosamine biosynthesis glycosyltransferase HpnI [Candidatus Eremiobacteraeota bacterium]|nr:bacteriohopanetetrol glucosamine biosynthesis glycosyltransferase HpnI [Candidatus Eremiobacteraeota bacterium]